MMKMRFSVVKLAFPLIKPPFQISQFSNTRSSPPSSSSSSSSSTSESPFIVDYLIQSLGFSRENALSASRQLIRVKNPNRPDSVVAFLRKVGLSQTQLSNTILRRPAILLSGVKLNLLPKIVFLNSICDSREELPELVACFAVCLGNSVDGRLVPALGFLRKVVKDEEKVRDALKRCPWILTNDPQKVPLRNLTFLQKKGLDEFSISELVYKSPMVLVCKIEQLNSAWKTVEEMGLCPEDENFAESLHVVITMSKDTLMRKSKILSSYGFEKSSLKLLVRWAPSFVRSKDECMKKKLDFFIKTLGYDPESLLKKNVFQLKYSLEARVMPRYKVIEDLRSRGLVRKKFDFRKVLNMSEEEFAYEYVDKFNDFVPEMDLVDAGIVQVGLKSQNKRIKT